MAAPRDDLRHVFVERAIDAWEAQEGREADPGERPADPTQWRVAAVGSKRRRYRWDPRRERVAAEDVAEDVCPVCGGAPDDPQPEPPAITGEGTYGDTCTHPIHAFDEEAS